MINLAICIRPGGGRRVPDAPAGADPSREGLHPGTKPPPRAEGLVLVRATYHAVVHGQFRCPRNARTPSAVIDGTASPVRQLPAGPQAVKIHNRVEHQEVTSLSVPAPERVIGKQHDMTFAVRRIDNRGVLLNGQTSSMICSFCQNRNGCDRTGRSNTETKYADLNSWGRVELNCSTLTCDVWILVSQHK